MLSLVKVPESGEIPIKGNPLGLAHLPKVRPTGDRGLSFGRSKQDGVPLGKIPGYWTCPYNGILTAVYLNTDQGGFTVKFWKSPNIRSPVVSDSINRRGCGIISPFTHSEIFDMSDFLFLDVSVGDTISVEIVEVSSPAPTDISGSLLILKSEEPSSV